MNVIIKNGDLFRKIVGSLKDLLLSGEFIFDQESVKLQSADSSKVVIVDVFMDINSFDKYSVSETTKLEFNFENLQNVLNLSKSEQIGLTYKEGADKVSLKLNDNSKKVQFNLLLSSTDKDELDIHEIIYDTKIYVDSSEFRKSIKDLSTFGNKCSISAGVDNMSLAVSGDVGSGEVVIDGLEIEGSGGNLGTFGMKYLNLFAKAGLTDEVVLKFAKDMPFCFEYPLQHGHVRFYLLPMIEE